MFDDLHPALRRTFRAQFICKACGRTFRRELERIFIHLPALDQIETAPDRPFVIPEPITCPRCAALNRYELTDQTRSMLILSLLETTKTEAEVDFEQPVLPITFAMYDRTVMHPQEALQFYREKVEQAPDDAQMRLRLANTYRTSGDYEHAAEEYQRVLEMDPNELEAWINLAAIHVYHKRFAEAKKILQEIVQRAPSSGHRDWRKVLQHSRDFLEGILPLDELIPMNLIARLSPEREKPKRRRRRRHEKAN